MRGGVIVKEKRCKKVTGLSVRPRKTGNKTFEGEEGVRRKVAIRKGQLAQKGEKWSLKRSEGQVKAIVPGRGEKRKERNRIISHQYTLRPKIW